MSTFNILSSEQVAALSTPEMIAYVQALQKHNEEEQANLRSKLEASLKASAGKLSFKVSEKGALSVYGMGKWPVTLYRRQWERLITAIPEIQAFITANSDRLTVKDGQ